MMDTAQGSGAVGGRWRRRGLAAIGTAAVIGFAWAGTMPLPASAAATHRALLSQSPHLLAPSGAVNTYVVNSTADAGGTCPGADCTLRQAVTNANSDGTLDLITFGSATNGTPIVLASVITIGDTGGVIIQGNGAGTTVVDGGGVTQVLSIPGGVPANISGLTVQNGLNAADGGGIWLQGSVVLDHVTVRDNVVTGTSNNGGGIYVGGSTVSLWVLNSVLDGNVTDGSGGALWSDGAVSMQNTVVQNNLADHTAAGSGAGGGVVNEGPGSLDGDNVTFSGNSFGTGTPVSGDIGGGLYTDTSLLLQNSAFRSNHADQGGGVFNDYGAEFDATTFSGNTALRNGGGLYNETSGDQTVLNGDDFTSNTAASGGGGVHIDSGGHVTMRGGTVASNSVSAGNGGGVDALGNLDVIGTSFSGNSASGDGGGLFTDDNLSMSLASITGNTAGANGGGIAHESNNASFVDMLVSGNTAASDGGGMYLGAGGSAASLDGITVTRNTAARGAGILNHMKLTTSDVWVDSNTASGDGGGLWNGGNSTLRSTTLSNNSAGGNGGGLFSTTATGQVTNSTVTGNTATGAGSAVWNGGGVLQLFFSTLVGTVNVGSGSTDAFRGTLVSGSCTGTGLMNSNGFNLESPGSTCNFHGQGDQPNVGNPLLGTLGFNGGFAPTVPLLGGSPAIDGAGANCNVSTDERNIPRPQLNGCDIGAFEYTSAGYWLVASDGGIFPFGSAIGYGSLGNKHLNAPVVGMAPTPDRGGYWLVAADGGIFPFGNAVGYGSTGNIRLNKPVVGMAATPTGKGYWLVASDGGVFPFGDAGGFGSTGNVKLNQPMVGMAATPDGRGYWLVASDGGIFPFGDAGGFGSTGNVKLNQAIVGMASTASGNGYWLVAADGGIFPFGDATQHSYGSTGNIKLNKPVVGMAATSDGNGYWLVASDGGVFPFGNALGLGSTGNITLNKPMVGMAA
jgi:CSLREA domain-containing protein